MYCIVVKCMLSGFSFFASLSCVVVFSNLFFVDALFANEIKKSVVNMAFVKQKSSKNVQDSVLLGLYSSLSGQILKSKDAEKEIKIILKGLDKKTDCISLCDFVHDNNIKFLIAGYGLKVSSDTLKWANTSELPVLGWLSGDPKLYKLGGNIFFNYRASFADEIKSILEFFEQKTDVNMAILIEENLLDDEMRQSLDEIFKDFPIFKYTTFCFKKDQKKMESVLKSVDKFRPDAIILLGEPQDIAGIVKKARTHKNNKMLQKAHLFLLSSTYAEFMLPSIKKLTSDQKKNIYYSQVVPDNKSSNIPLVKDYQEDVKKFCDANKKDMFRSICSSSHRVNSASLEAYIIGKIALETVRKSEDETRGSLKKTLQDLNVDLGGVKVKFSDYKNYKKVKASSRVYLTELDGDNFISYQNKN